MSNRSYVIALSEQTFIHSWRISPQTFVNSVSNKQCSWTHIASRVQQTHSALPLTKARIGLERQRQTCAVWAKRTEYSIKQIRQSLQRLKIAKLCACKICTIFEQLTAFFFRHTFAIQVVNHWPTPIANSYGRTLVTLRAHALAFLETTHPVKKTLAQFMTYEQLFIYRIDNLPRSNVSIVLTKLAIVNTSSRKQEWTFVHSVVLHLIHQKFN